MLHAGATAYSYSYFGGGTGGVYLDNLHCTGSESRLIDCRHNGIGVHDCDHTDDAGVRCECMKLNLVFSLPVCFTFVILYPLLSSSRTNRLH